MKTSINPQREMTLYGLIGKHLSHSRSKQYFSQKFATMGLTDRRYDLFELPAISHFPALLARYPSLKGLNVTVPYKQEVLGYIDVLSPEARAIGAVNTIKINANLTGYNTDAPAFKKTLLEFFPDLGRPAAMILGTGGAAAAVGYALRQLNLECLYVSSDRHKVLKDPAQIISYDDLSEDYFAKYKLIVNATPVGMYPNVMQSLKIPFQFIDRSHFCYDLIYNPLQTQFLKRAKEEGARTANGLTMLNYQAEEAWKIWNL